MAIDPATIVWDDEPQVQPQRAQAIDPATVIWDEMPITDLPMVNAEPPDFSGVTATVRSTPDRQRRATDSMSTSERFRAGLGKSMVDTGFGLAQLAVDQFSRPANIAQGLVDRVAPGGAIADAVGRTNDLWLKPQQYMQNLAAERRATDADLVDTTSGSAGKIVGDIATLLVPGSAASRATTVAGRIGGNALVGAGAGAIQPVLSEQERNKNALVGGALGAAGGAVGEGLGALASRARSAVDPTRSRLIELAKQSGIPLHISQVSESVPLKTLASAAKYLPFSGAGKAAGRQQEAFNRAVGRTFGADAGKLTDEVMAAARRRISDGYEQIYARNDIPIDPAAIRQLVAVETSVGKRLTQDQSKVVANQLDMILDEVAASGALTGKKYQALRTQIMKAEGPAPLGSAVKEFRQALDDIAGRAVGPDDAAALRQLRGEWANLKTVQSLLGQVAGAGENVRPAALWPAVRKGSTREMRDLARMGQTLLKDPIPDSGTAGRLLSYGALGQGGLSGGAAIPGILGLIGTGAIAGRALNSSRLAQLAANPGVTTSALARISPLASLAAVPLVVGEPERRPDGGTGKSGRKDGR